MYRDDAYLLDIFLAARKIQEFVGSATREEFKASELLQSAVICQCQIIGEAARKISDEMKEHYPTIPWFEMAGMRNRLIHEYFRVSVDILWQAVQTDIPKLIDQILPLLPPESK